MYFSNRTLLDFDGFFLEHAAKMNAIGDDGSSSVATVPQTISTAVHLAQPTLQRHADSNSLASPPVSSTGVQRERASPNAIVPQFSHSGWLLFSYFSDGGCAVPLHAEGFQVNTCYLNNGIGFKYQMYNGKYGNAIFLMYIKSFLCH